MVQARSAEHGRSLAGWSDRTTFLTAVHFRFEKRILCDTACRGALRFAVFRAMRYNEYL